MRVVVVGALYGALGVGLGAFAAHLGDTPVISVDSEIVRTAVLYQLFHAATMVGMGALRDHVPSTMLGVTSWAIGLGVLFFSGSLYALALGAPSQIGLVTPIGGGLLIIGWLLLAVTAARRV